MDVKLGNSLWTQPVELKTLAVQSAAGADFQQKLGLEPQGAKAAKPSVPGHGAARSVDSEQLHGWALAGSLERAQASRAASAMVAPDHVCEQKLYEMAGRATGHLSYLAGPTPALTALPSRVPVPGDEVVACRGPSVALSATDTVSSPTAQPDHAAPLQGRQLPPLSATSSALPTTPSLLQTTLSRLWPERNVQVLARGDGFDLLVRDYHLGPDDQQRLVNELTQRLQQQADVPRNLWLNGQQLWSTTPITTYPRSTEHGS